MGSSNIEFLDARRGKDSKVPKQRGALRHLDAAHAKLEKLHVWRRELKEKYEQRVAEVEIAVRAIGNLETQLSELDQALEDKTRELDEAQVVVETQKDLIVQLLDELAEKEDAEQASTAPVLVEADGPALTARVLAKLSEKG